MRQVFFFIFSSLLVLGCSKETTVELVKFTDTGCSRESVAPSTKVNDDSESQLILKYSTEGLEVIRTNAMMNCSINNGGISCDVSCEGNIITFHAFETDGPILDCLCPVSNMSSVVAGLSLGKEYVLDYKCGNDTFIPISFTYSKDLQMVLDAGLYKL